MQPLSMTWVATRLPKHGRLTGAGWRSAGADCSTTEKNQQTVYQTISPTIDSLPNDCPNSLSNCQIVSQHYQTVCQILVLFGIRLNLFSKRFFVCQIVANYLWSG